MTAGCFGGQLLDEGDVNTGGESNLKFLSKHTSEM